jgi:serine/threonine-protein kinase OSR1/STK39
MSSDRAEDYTIGPPIGFGASSIVYAATYHGSDNGSSTESKGVPCALKVLDLDSLPVRALQLLQRETTLMSLSKHPNVLRVRGSWVDGHKLYIALRLMNKGSAADVMRYGWPGGMEEDVVRCILRQALKGLKSVLFPQLEALTFIICSSAICTPMDLSIVMSKPPIFSSTTTAQFY